MTNKESLLPSGIVTIREAYLERLRCMNPVNVWYVTSLCKDLVLYTGEEYKLHIWAIGSTVTGERPQRSWNKPQDIDLLLTHDKMLDGTTFKDQHYFLSEFEKMFLEWVERQSTRFEIIESGFSGRFLGSGCLWNLGGAFLVPKVWSETPINFIVPSESKGGKEELEKIRQGKLVVLYPKCNHSFFSP